MLIGGLYTFVTAQPGTVKSHQKISLTEGNFNGSLGLTDLFGSSVTAIGDVDGDNVPDLAVGAQYDDDGGTDKGAVWILFMNSNNTVKSHQKVSADSGSFTGSLDDYDRFGHSIAGLGDLDNDNVPDLVVGAYLDDDGNDAQGAIWILFLNTNGTVKSYQKISGTQGGFPANELGREDWFGFSVATIGDLDKDGVVDIAVGAAKDDDCNCPHSAPNVGAVWILFLNPNGTVKSYQKISRTQGNFTHATDTLHNDDKFGSAVAALGDLNNDGILDIVVGASQDDDGCIPNTGEYDKGAVWILFLNTDGTVKSFQKISDTAGGFTGTLDPDDEFGNSAALIGDLNGDAIPDLAVGAYKDDDDVWAGSKDYGAVWILFMNSNGTVKSFQKINKNQGDFTGTLNLNDWLGYSIAALRDANNDGFPDLAVGAPWDDNDTWDSGAVWQLFLDGTAAGSADLIVTDIDFSNIGCTNDNISGSIVVTIKNQGTISASNFQVSLATDGCLSFSNQSVTSLAPNGSTILTFNISGSWADCSDCNCDFTATADANGNVTESDENNNGRTETFNSTLPDLVVNSITPAVNCSADGNFSGSVKVNVSNNGCANAGGVVVQLVSTCGFVFVNQTVDLVKGMSTNMNFNYTPNPAVCMNCVFIATIDPANAICECSSANNSIVSGALDLNFPDLKINSDNLTVGCASDGQASVSGTITLANNGCGDALTANVPIQFTLYDNNGCAGNIIEQWTENLSSVTLTSGGGTQTFTIVPKSITSNMVINSNGCQVSIFIEADYNNSICESDGTNNTYCADNKNVDIPDVEVQSETLNISCVNDGQFSVSGAVTLKNNGCGSNLSANVPMRFTMFDNTGCTGNPVSQWTETFSAVNIASGGGTQVFSITTHNETSNLCTNSSNCQVSIQIEADYSNTVCEGDGTDNTFCADNKAVIFPDLIVNSMTAQIESNGQGRVVVNVGNTGCGNAAGAVVRLTSDCGLTFSDQTVDLNGGQNKDVTFISTSGTATPACNLTVTIDPGNNICECDGTNNTGTGSFSDQLDFGDAPDPLFAVAGQYPTLLAYNGARHVLNTNIYLGSKIDKDNDGQQNNKADGDDGDAGGDDEDGIASDTLKLVEGTIPVIDVQVKNTSGQTVTIKGWIDYNGDGVFEATESATNTTMVSGTKTLTFPQAPYGSTSNTFARFRVSSDAAAIENPTGVAPNGEVEDYFVIIDQDTDKDGVSDLTETTGDRDGDTITNDLDYDPTGYFYNEADAKIISGGKINVTGPGAITIIKDGSNGYYQFLTDGKAGIYTMQVTLPTGYDWSTNCTVTAGAVDPTGKPNPYVLGNGEDGTTGYLTSNNCTEFYLEFDLEANDPFVFNNNFPLQSTQPTNIVLSSFTAAVENKTVILNWVTETEPDNAGFYVFRSQHETNDFVQINPSLIPAMGDVFSGATYEYTDQLSEFGTYYYKLQSISLQDVRSFHGPITVAATSVDVKKNIIPENYSLSQNYPNPFNPETTIEFGLPTPGFVEISIYDINGKLVRTLVSEEKRAGNHWLKWDVRDNSGNKVTSGLYFYYFNAGSFSRTLKMILMK